MNTNTNTRTPYYMRARPGRMWSEHKYKRFENTGNRMYTSCEGAGFIPDDIGKPFVSGSPIGGVHHVKFPRPFPFHVGYRYFRNWLRENYNDSRIHVSTYYPEV